MYVYISEPIKLNIMRFTTHLRKDIQTDGTFLQGKINIDYDTLVKKLGSPKIHKEYIKVDAEWELEIYPTVKSKKPVIATIYNWKNGKNFSEYGFELKDICEWHIGGFDDKSVKYVKKLLNKK